MYLILNIWIQVDTMFRMANCMCTGGVAMSPELSSALADMLVETLPALARMIGGCVVLTEPDGRIIHALACGGRPAPEAVGCIHPTCRTAARQQRPLTSTGRDEPEAPEQPTWTCPCQGEILAIPLGYLVLGIGNGARTARDAALQAALAEALPVIARMTGGIAVAFDGEGRRLRVVKSDGRELSDLIGHQNQADRAAMELQRPVIGPSNMVPGAMAVRIPITSEFGLGFNNALAVPADAGTARSGHPRARYTLDDIIGESPQLQAVRHLAAAAATSSAPLCITGETGTGKELLAQAVHNAGPRHHQPFVAVNCAALPDSLFESTLFGYIGGAFTGADQEGRPGLFEEADGGTLLLDEIGELPPAMQAKLLRVLQEREVLRIGTSRPRPVDVRVICTTHRELSSLVQAGRFRADLFYRLDVLSVHLPPLCQRSGDLPILARHLLPRLAATHGKPVYRWQPAVERALLAHDWPGNIRELQNCLERAVILCEGNTLQVSHLPLALQHPRAHRPGGRAARTGLEVTVRSAEHEALIEALAAVGGNRSLAARQLGISITTLWRKLKRLEGTAPPLRHDQG